MSRRARAQQMELREKAYREREYLYGIHDVLGSAVGFRVKNGEMTDEPVLTVYVRAGRREQDRSDHPPHQRIPRRIRLDVEGDTVWLPVDLVESEPGELCSGHPVRSGLSVGNGRRTDSGTIGWIARLQLPPSLPVFCTAFHVLLRDGSKVTGGVDKLYTFVFPDFEDVVSPSVEDGGEVPRDHVGHVLAARRNKLVDVAVVSPRDAELVEAVALDIGPIGPARYLTSQDIDVAVPLHVQLRGRSTTSVATGAVVRFPAAHLFNYPDRPHGLMMLELIETDIKTRKGDSGALLLDDARRPLGMLVGRARDSSFFIHIRNVIEVMGLTDF